MKKKLILIDLDDTLWDTWANNKESLKELYTALEWGRYFSSFDTFFDEYYYPINHELWQRYNREEISKTELSLERLRLPFVKLLNQDKELTQDSLKTLNNLVEDNESYWQSANDSFLRYIGEKTGLCAGAIQLIKYLHERYKVCILSNGFPEVQYTKLETSGLSPYVHAVVLSDEVGYNKPNPKIFHYALNLLGYTPSDSIMIGDSWSSDIEGAKNAEIDSIWYNRYALETPQDSLAHPIAVVQDLHELLSIL